jgi:hypothetical protein
MEVGVGDRILDFELDDFTINESKMRFDIS